MEKKVKRNAMHHAYMVQAQHHDDSIGAFPFALGLNAFGPLREAKNRLKNQTKQNKIKVRVCACV